MVNHFYLFYNSFHFMNLLSRIFLLLKSQDDIFHLLSKTCQNIHIPVVPYCRSEITPAYKTAHEVMHILLLMILVRESPNICMWSPKCSGNTFTTFLTCIKKWTHLRSYLGIISQQVNAIAWILGIYIFYRLCHLGGSKLFSTYIWKYYTYMHVYW